MNLNQCKVCLNSDGCTFPEGKCNPRIHNGSWRYTCYPEILKPEEVPDYETKDVYIDFTVVQ